MSAWSASGSVTSPDWYAVVIIIILYLHVNLTFNRCCLQKGHPLASANCCQLLLKYILVNRKNFIKAFHNRVYAYSSGTKFLECSNQLQLWLDGVDDARALDPSIQDPRVTLKHLINVRGLYSILGDAIIDFMERKPEPYLRGALMSKENFWNVPVFKRAMTAVFLIRFMLGYKAQRMWKKFTVSDLKLNARCFKKWTLTEAKIFSFSAKYQALPDHTPVVPTPPAVQNKRNMDAASSTDSPMKRTYIVADGWSDDE